MSAYTLKVRRYQPEATEDDKRGAYWETFDVELDPTLSVLDGLLQAKNDEDGTIAVRCSCRAAICGSCGVKINGQSTLACKTQLGEAAEEARDRPARDEPVEITVEPMGNMPVIKDLVTDMESTHWTKFRRVTPWLLAVRPAAGARVHRPRRGDGRRHPVGRLHPVRRLRLVLPLDGGRPGLHRPGRARQGLPLRRRPARRPDDRAALRPRQRPARHVRLHPLLLVHRRLPEGRRADEPDHAAAPPRPRRAGDRRRQQRPPPRDGLRQEHREEGHARRVAAAAGVLRTRDQGQADAAADRDQGPLRVDPDGDPRHSHGQDAVGPEADPGRASQAPRATRRITSSGSTSAPRRARSSSTSTSSTRARRTKRPPRRSSPQSETSTV